MGHAILHAATLIRLRPSGSQTFSPMQLAMGTQPNISHLRTFGCAVYVPIAPPQRTKMGLNAVWASMLDLILIPSYDT